MHGRGRQKLLSTDWSCARDCLQDLLRSATWFFGYGFKYLGPGPMHFQLSFKYNVIATNRWLNSETAAHTAVRRGERGDGRMEPAHLKSHANFWNGPVPAFSLRRSHAASPESLGSPCTPATSAASGGSRSCWSAGTSFARKSAYKGVPPWEASVIIEVEETVKTKNAFTHIDLKL